MLHFSSTASRLLIAISISIALPVLAAENKGAQVTTRMNVTQAGAIGDGTTLNTERLQAAIEQLAAKGGGTLVIPQGVFVTSSIYLKPGVNLHLEKDAVLKCTTDQSLFPKGRTRIEGHFQDDYNPAMINAAGCDDLRITGEGTLDGAGRPIWDQVWSRSQAGAYGTARLRICLIENSRNVVIDGPTFKDSQFWNLHLYNCREVLVKNSRFVVPDDYKQAPSSDGVDVDSCQDVKIQDCFFSVTDDCIALKGNRYDGLNQEPASPPVKNVLIENCTFVRGHGALTLGTEAQSISDIEMRDCTVRGNMPMLRLKLRPDTPNQNYSNIRVRDIKLEGAEGKIVFVSPYHGTNARQRPAQVTSKISNVTVENISGSFGAFGSISGGTTAIVSDFFLRNIQVSVEKEPNLNTEGVTNVRLENVAVQQVP